MTGGEDVEITYYWVDSNAEAKVILEPPPGTTYVIEKVEIQTTDDVVMSCEIRNAVLVDGSTIGLPVPAGTMVEARRPTVIKNQRDIHNWAHVTHPVAPAQGSGSARGMDVTLRIHEVIYLSEVPLLSSLKTCMKVSLDKNEPFAGTWASIVIYGITDEEAA